MFCLASLAKCAFRLIYFFQRIMLACLFVCSPLTNRQIGTKQTIDRQSKLLKKEISFGWTQKTREHGSTTKPRIGNLVSVATVRQYVKLKGRCTVLVDRAWRERVCIDCYR